ncbi:MAG TPA: toll/interleukin-1 receptor domain-containing protein [Thermoanaerobaculia bacterium]|nr:toll/interleukin-1 receptor domain-containing protein [Thermoanaerobaculia bacterium]
MSVFSPEEEDYWNELLLLIRGGLVVPVIGSELLQLGSAPELLYQRLARDLAAELKLTVEPPASLHDVACRYLEQRRAKSLSAVYVTLRKLLETPGRYPIPEPLRKLASIAPLQLFLTTTFDSSLEKAIDETRYRGRPTTRAVAYSLDYGGDLPDEMKEGTATAPIVFHLFGLPAPFNKFAVTDEDVLEYIHSLQSGTHRPEALFQYVADKHLLIIGSSFSDWLARFFIRSAKRERLWNARGREDFLVDGGREQSLATFVQNFGGGMKLFRLAPVAFVDELHRRWMAEQPAPAVAAAEPAEAADNVELTKMTSGSIFLSYASEDRAVADSIARQLDDAKLDVWLDHRKLRGGQNFEHVIRRNVKEASLFIALISRQALTGGYSFFRTEWRDALETARGMPPSPPYLILVFIDETRIDSDRDLFPPEFSELHWEIAENGVLSAKQIASIVDFFVEQQRLREVAR